MNAVLIDCDRIESSQTVDKTRLVNDLRSSPAVSAFTDVGGFNYFWGVEEGSRGVNSRQGEAVTLRRGCGMYRRNGRSTGFTG